MINYVIVTERTGEFEHQIDVFVTDDGVQIMQATTSVCVETKEEAETYAKEVFIPDLQRTFPRQLPAPEPEKLEGPIIWGGDY